jgi:hypothetical protein
MKRDKILEAYERSILKEESQAGKEYMKSYKEVVGLMKNLSKKIEKHKKEFINDERDRWGFVGDINHLKQQLIDINDYFMVK